MIKKTLIAIVIYLMPFMAPTALASGIGVSPSKLDLQAPAQTTGQLTVANPTADAQTFQIYAPDFPSAITVEPNDFALGPGGRKTVSIRVDAKRLSAEIQNRAGAPFVTSLDVLARPLDKKNLAVAAGVKIPLTVILPPPSDQNLTGHSIAAVFFFAGLFLLCLIVLKRHRLPLKKIPPAGFS